MLRLILFSQRFIWGFFFCMISLCLFMVLESGNSALLTLIYGLSIGIELMLVGISDAAEIYGNGVTTQGDIERLKTLTSKMKSGLRKIMRHTQNCYTMYCMLVYTKYRQDFEAFSLARRDSIWKRARSLSLKSARRGYRDCDRLLKISVEYPDILMLREAYRHIVEICTDCPVLDWKNGEFTGCYFRKATNNREENNE